MHTYINRGTRIPTSHNQAFHLLSQSGQFDLRYHPSCSSSVVSHVTGMTSHDDVRMATNCSASQISSDTLSLETLRSLRWDFILVVPTLWCSLVLWCCRGAWSVEHKCYPVCVQTTDPVWSCRLIARKHDELSLRKVTVSAVSGYVGSTYTHFNTF